MTYILTICILTPILAILCWKEEVFNYSGADSSITELLSQNISMGDNVASVFEVLIGNVPSAMGENGFAGRHTGESAYNCRKY